MEFDKSKTAAHCWKDLHRPLVLRRMMHFGHIKAVSCDEKKVTAALERRAVESTGVD